MEEYLRTVEGGLGEDASDRSVHVVLGGPEADVDTVAATLCLALHLSQTSDVVCAPILCRQQRDARLPGETLKYLQKLRISERSLLWCEDIDLVKIHRARKLSLTLLRDGLLDSSEFRPLESSVLRVVHHGSQQDAGDDGASSAVMAVAREILQEAPVHIGVALTEPLQEALLQQSEAYWLKYGRQSTQLEELLRSLEKWSKVSASLPDPAKLQDLKQKLSKELREFSDGETTIAFATVTADDGHWFVYEDGIKAFCHQRGYEGLTIVSSVCGSVLPPRQQVVVYSNNADILNQICCELDESSSWTPSSDLEASDCLRVFNMPLNTASACLLEEEIRGFIKEFVDRRSSVLACHPSSRTSSTEGVAGSVEFSQGSSGINDMDVSDIDRVEGGIGDVAAERVIPDDEEDTVGGEVGPIGELVSPDSGMTTIRSSRSSKESSVFLSDDSPIGEVIGGGGPGGLFLRNISPLGLSSLSPPVQSETKRHRSSKTRSDNFDLFNFDPLNASDHSLSIRGESANSEKPGIGERTAASSSQSENEELSMVDFSATNSLGCLTLDSRLSSADNFGQLHGNEILDTMVPPTPVNSLIGSRPSSSCGVRFFPEDVVERINGLQHKDSVSSSLSETWEELGFESHGALLSNDSNIWSRSSDSKSPQNIVQEGISKESIEDVTKRESRETIMRLESAQQRVKCLEPQMSLIIEQSESHEDWNPDSALKDQWNPVCLIDLQLTPPEEEITAKYKTAIPAYKETAFPKKKEIINTLTPDTSKEDDDVAQGKGEGQQKELLDFWTYSAQMGFLKPDCSTTTSYPESLDMWNMTIRDDSLSPLMTPDNLSENSGSLCGVSLTVGGGTSLESPQGFSDGGMEMWNTTIQEDSSATPSPEGDENGRRPCHTQSWNSTDTLDATYPTKKAEEKKPTKEQTNEDHVFGDNDSNVKIFVVPEEESEPDDQNGLDKEHFIQNAQSDHSKVETLGAQMWDLPVPGMVTSVSEYDNVGASSWSFPSSPETLPCPPVVDMIQLEEQSSPFLAVTKPGHTSKGFDQYQRDDLQRKTESGDTISSQEKSVKQVFLFEGTCEMSCPNQSVGSSIEKKPREREGDDFTDQVSNNSPFILVENSDDELFPADRHSSLTKPAEIEVQTDQSLSPSIPNNDDELSIEGHGHAEETVAEAVSLSTSFGERDTLKYSSDSLHPGSRDELRSNSDGDSSSGLEMEYIIVSGSVKEAEREWSYGRKESNRQAKEAKKTMETFSMLSYAATLLKNQAQASHREHPKNIERSRNEAKRHDTESTPGGDARNQIVSDAADMPFETIASNRFSSDQSPYNAGGVRPQESIQDASEDHGIAEILSSSQSKPVSDAFHQSDSRWPTQTEEGTFEDKSNLVVRSLSPSLRYPSDHFLKTREEVYVHSQISMEESDDGGLSPPANRPAPANPGDFQDWGAQSVRAHTPQSAYEPKSPALTHSSVSQPSSVISSPASDSSISSGRGLGLPFSGDLMEEENGDEEQEDTAAELHRSPKLTGEIQPEKTKSCSYDLLSFTEELIGGCSRHETDQQTHATDEDMLLQDTPEYGGRRTSRTVAYEEWPVDQQIEQHAASRESHPAARSWSPTADNGSSSSSSFTRRPQNVELFSQSTTENPTLQWTGGHSQGQYGYNYHHIDQRTENQAACVDIKPTGQQNTSDVYAEFTTDQPHFPYGAEQHGLYCEPNHGRYNLDASGTTFQYTGESEYGGESHPMCASELQRSQYQDGETHQVHYPSGEETVCPSNTRSQREDHARYVPEGYMHFLLSRRHSQQADDSAGMIEKMASGGEDMENKEALSEDLSVGSNLRRKLAAPPLNVSLDHSEGSLLSDTEDEALDTGDDLDMNIDELDTSDEADSVEFNRQEHTNRIRDSEESNRDPGAASNKAPAGQRAADDGREGRLWRSVVIGEQEHRIDMKCIEPYKRVISHGGYYVEQNAIIVFAACFLPDSDCENYNYVMENLFLYVISTLELMVAEDYMIVYLNGATPRRRMPGFTWMKKCYQMIDRRLKKNLKMFIIVHPSWFIRTLLGITRPFISSKFSSKIKYVNSLQELGQIIPMEYVHIPPSIVKLDAELLDTTAKVEKKGNSV